MTTILLSSSESLNQESPSVPAGSEGERQSNHQTTNLCELRFDLMPPFF